MKNIKLLTTVDLEDLYSQVSILPAGIMESQWVGWDEVIKGHRFIVKVDRRHHEGGRYVVGTCWVCLNMSGDLHIGFSDTFDYCTDNLDHLHGVYEYLSVILLARHK